MTPERTDKVNGYVVKEFYWTGKMVVYIDNKLANETFDDAVERLRVCDE